MKGGAAGMRVQSIYGFRGVDAVPVYGTGEAPRITLIISPSLVHTQPSSKLISSRVSIIHSFYSNYFVQEYSENDSAKIPCP